MMWPGANYAYQGKNITYTKSFDPQYDYFRRVDDVILLDLYFCTFILKVLGNYLDYSSQKASQFNYVLH